jgi:hypothetical protein
MGYFECNKEFCLGDMGNSSPDEVFDLAAIYTLKYTKAPNVEWLRKMRRVCRKAKGDNTVLLAVVFEFG